MPDTSFTGIQVPDGDDGYSFEQQLGALADSARVIIPAANLTAAEQARTAATAAGFPATAANPLFVYRTDEDALFRHTGSGGWVRVSPRRSPVAVHAQRVIVTIPAGDTTGSKVISFPSGIFSTTPWLGTTTSNQRFVWIPNSTTSATSAEVWVRTWDGQPVATSQDTGVDVVAVQY